ncbi:hypothetical protein U1Q18_013625 [Sarracenia purpurea var. burkii]
MGFMSNHSTFSARNVNMEEQEEKAIDAKCHGKLNYNAPLLSTRRPNGGADAGSRFSRTSSQGVGQDSSNRVPFSWEQTPGNPKDLETDVTHDTAVVPLPKLPPGRWHPANEPVKVAKTIRRPDNAEHDDGCDGDIEDDDDEDGENDDYDIFSDAIDIFSLSESVDMVESCDKVEEEENSGSAQSPSFIIQRFLADASAMASTSGLALSKNLNKKLPRSSGRKSGQSEIAPEGCGFDYFLPWRMKHKPCGLKSPVREASLNTKPEWGGRRKQKR